MKAKKIIIVLTDGNSYTYTKLRGKTLYFNENRQDAIEVKFISKKQFKKL